MGLQIKKTGVQVQQLSIHAVPQSLEEKKKRIEDYHSLIKQYFTYSLGV